MIAAAKQRRFFLFAFLFASLPAIALADSDSVTVDCASGWSIQNAVGMKNPDRPLTVVIRGACSQDITLTRDDVTLVGEGGTLNGTINIVGARRVLIRDLTVSSPTGPGIFGTENAAFTVQDSVLERNGTDGVLVRNGAQATLRRNRLADNGRAGIPDTGRGIQATHGGSVDAEDNTIVDNRSDGVGVYNDSYARLVRNTIERNGRAAVGDAGVQLGRSRVRGGGNIIRNNTGSAALTVGNHSDYRTGTGLNADLPDNEFVFEQIQHPVGAGLVAIDVNNASFGDLRQVNIVGSISVGDHSMVQVRGDQVGPTQCSTVDSTGGFISVSGRFGLLRLRATSITPGPINVNVPFGLLDNVVVVCP